MNELIILGCGSSDALKNYNANVAVINQQGTLLIDCGYSIKHALAAQNMGIESVDAIFITHIHGDHIFGLERIAFENYYKYHKKIALYLHPSLYKTLWDESLKGSLGHTDKGSAVLEDYFDVHFVEDKFELFGNHYQLLKVKHIKGVAAFGLNINEDIFYSGDTTPICEILQDLRFNVGLHDATFSASEVHSSVDSLLENYPEHIRKKLYLHGYPDNYLDYQDLVDKNFKGLTKQGMRIKFGQ
ncbi:MAG: MBL fold metallo-hydrolase [Candidatus Thioglobus sp.]|nr:MAG: MBL fold metallo-hydrolase [Candidatus Thioglobus sp.]KAA0449694.1 MAG: MBL fold metallo-hydrolase [Candidatus Thioglobus sp.]